MSKNPLHQDRPEGLNSQEPAFELSYFATSRDFFGMVNTFLFLMMVGQAVAGVIPIHAAENEGSFSARLHLPRARQEALPVIIIVPDTQ